MVRCDLDNPHQIPSKRKLTLLFVANTCIIHSLVHEVAKPASSITKDARVSARLRGLGPSTMSYGGVAECAQGSDQDDYGRGMCVSIWVRRGSSFMSCVPRRGGIVIMPATEANH